MKKILLTKRAIFVLGLLAVLILPAVPVTAYPTTEDSDVYISVDATTITDTGIAADVTVNYRTEDIFSEQQYLSYHIYNGVAADGTVTPLRYENERIAITSAGQQFGLTIDLTGLTSPTGGVYIEFDVVDEDDVFWFSTSERYSINIPAMTCPVPSVIPDVPAVPEPPAAPNENAETNIIDSIKENPVAFAVNAIIFSAVVISAVVILVRVRKEVKE